MEAIILQLEVLHSNATNYIDLINHFNKVGEKRLVTKYRAKLEEAYNEGLALIEELKDNEVRDTFNIGKILKGEQ